jgi:hypothetical protein
MIRPLLAILLSAMPSAGGAEVDPAAETIHGPFVRVDVRGFRARWGD